MSELEASGAGEPPPYIIFVVVFFFFITGLLGFLVCHLLKKKGYRCRAGDMDVDEEEQENLGGEDDEYEENQDTVEQILKCIIENEANMEAFNEMLGNHNLCVRHDPRVRKESIAGVPPHHHTVHSGMDHNSCHLCAQVRTKKGRRPSRTPRFKQRPGEQTVFAVGRFRVTHTDKKPQGSPNPLAISGDQLDQSQDSEERKDAGYNLRSMFKDVKPPSENTNGVAPNVGKRRKSLTLFGMRRGSDPVGVKVVEGTGREAGGIKFAIKQQPVVLEEPAQTENVQTQRETASKPKSETPKGKPTLLEAKTPESLNSPSSQERKQTSDSINGIEEADQGGLSPTKIMTSNSTALTTGSAPSTLPILSGKNIDVSDKVLKTEGAYDPGPLQTSTPIAPMPESILSVSPFMPAGQPDSYSTTGFPVTETPPDPSSPHQEPGPNLVLISLGSSPQSSFPSKTLSSVSSLVQTPSPKLSSRNIPSDTSATAFSPVLAPSPKLPASQQTSPKSLISPSSFGKVEQELEETAISKTETKKAGILKKTKLSPTAGCDSQVFGPSSPSGQLSNDRLSTLSLSPSLSQGTKTSVTIIKASPDSKREFSVVTMPENVSSASIMDKKEVTSEPGVKGEKREMITAVIQGKVASVSCDEQPESPKIDSAGIMGPERDDMMEMDDIKDCKVTQVRGVEMEEEKEDDGSVKSQPKQD